MLVGCECAPQAHGQGGYVRLSESVLMRQGVLGCHRFLWLLMSGAVAFYIAMVAVVALDVIAFAVVCCWFICRRHFTVTAHP